MILQGNQRGGSANLAQHLLKDENDHVELFDMRGFISDDLHGAFKEAYAASRATKAKQFLFSLSLNPPPSEKVPTEVFEETIDRVEHALGLAKQPRAIVFHEKEGRRHAHAVWSRIDPKEGKAVQLSFTKRKLMDISRELFLENGWQMPKGLARSELRDPRNFTLAQWQQAKRAKHDPKVLKAMFQECWAISDTQKALANALLERGVILARGDRRGFVAIDYKGEVFALAKWCGLKAKDLREKIVEPDNLPNVDEARSKVAETMQMRLAQLQTNGQAMIDERLSVLESKKQAMTNTHQKFRTELRARQQERWQSETHERQKRFAKGLRGILERVSGKRWRIERQNEIETLQATKRDQSERDKLIFTQLDERQLLQRRTSRLQSFGMSREKYFREELRDHQRFSKSKTLPSARPGRGISR
ncbi:MAG: relaxase/mobilization nuclease domain-containing protein [Pseudomonadaceae bacterium]|nr:relaxase/mobilization nuclease domain-containing protein [Pseudomonadaceae bacterium]